MEKSRETVIMIDDDITNLTVARNNLSEEYNFFTAPSGEKLFKLLERVTPSMILLDIEMPNMSGYEVMEILKKDERTAGIPVIFLTGRMDTRSEIEGLRMGAADFVTKPFTKELLIKRMELHMQFERQKKALMEHTLSPKSEAGGGAETAAKEQIEAIVRTVASLIECREGATDERFERTQHYISLLLDVLLGN